MPPDWLAYLPLLIAVVAGVAAIVGATMTLTGVVISAKTKAKVDMNTAMLTEGAAFRAALLNRLAEVEHARQEDAKRIHELEVCIDHLQTENADLKHRIRRLEIEKEQWDGRTERRHPPDQTRTNGQ